MITVTKIVYRGSSDHDKALSECDIVIDEALKITGVRLYKKGDGSFYLIFPSKQDIYNYISLLNKDVNLIFPEGNKKVKNKDWEEFYYPVSSGFYRFLLDVVVKGYSTVNSQSNKTYIPVGGCSYG